MSVTLWTPNADVLVEGEVENTYAHRRDVRDVSSANGLVKRRGGR